MPTRQEWDPELEQYVEVFVEEKRGRGRPRVATVQDRWLKFMGGGDSAEELPPEIILSEEAPLELLLVASFTNFINRNEMDDNVRDVLRKWRIDADLVASQREVYSKQVQTVRDAIYNQYRDSINEMGDYIMGNTTAGMGSVMSAMTGERDKRGKFRT